MLHERAGFVSRVLHFAPKPASCTSPNSHSTPGAIILSITYGIDSKSIDDQFLNENIEAAHAVAATLVPGKWLVDVIPIRGCLCTQTVTHKHLTYPLTVRHIPDWLPGMGFKVHAKEVREKFKISVDGPMNYVRSAMKVRPQRTSTPDCVPNLSVTTRPARELSP